MDVSNFLRCSFLDYFAINVRNAIAYLFRKHVYVRNLNYDKHLKDTSKGLLLHFFYFY